MYCPKNLLFNPTRKKRQVGIRHPCFIVLNILRQEKIRVQKMLPDIKANSFVRCEQKIARRQAQAAKIYFGVAGLVKHTIILKISKAGIQWEHLRAISEHSLVGNPYKLRSKYYRIALFLLFLSLFIYLLVAAKRFTCFVCGCIRVEVSWLPPVWVIGVGRRLRK